MKTLHTWLREKPGRTALLATRLGLSQPFVTQMATGAKAIPVAHGAAIEHFTDGAVTRQEMFPDTWQRYWPELVETSKQKAATVLDGQALGAIAFGVA
ncbi:MAG: YdaS family helix-turn-helix protein [Burkholderiaceae bacterium]